MGVLQNNSKKAAEKFGFGEDMIFHDADELVRHGKLADCVINGTMDEDHVRTTVPLLEAGYDVLLEKPFAVTRDEVKILDEAVKRTGRKVMICHVLRYSDFYVAIKERILNGEIGKIVSIKEETVMIETGHDRMKIRILKTAVRNVDVHAEDAQD